MICSSYKSKSKSQRTSSRAWFCLSDLVRTSWEEGDSPNEVFQCQCQYCLDAHCYTRKTHCLVSWSGVHPLIGLRKMVDIRGPMMAHGSHPRFPCDVFVGSRGGSPTNGFHQGLVFRASRPDRFPRADHFFAQRNASETCVT